MSLCTAFIKGTQAAAAGLSSPGELRCLQQSGVACSCSSSAVEVTARPVRRFLDITSGAPC